jgi:hypothetical protein
MRRWNVNQVNQDGRLDWFGGWGHLDEMSRAEGNAFLCSNNHTGAVEARIDEQTGIRNKTLIYELIILI